MGMDPRQLGRVGGEHLGQHVGQIVQQGEPIRHLAGSGRPQVGRFRIRLRPIPDIHLNPGMGLQPLRHGRDFSVGKQGEGPPGEVHQEGAIGVIPNPSD